MSLKATIKQNLIQTTFLLLSLIFIFGFLAFYLRNFSLFLLCFSILSIILTINLRKFQDTFFLCAVIFSVLSISEFILYKIYQSKFELTFDRDKSTYVTLKYSEYDRRLGYKLLEGQYRSRKLKENGEALYDVIYTIAQDGYRVTPGVKNSNSNFLGGSFAFGEGLNDNETIPSYLNENFDLKFKNYGVHGYGVHQSLKILQDLDKKNMEMNILLTAPFHAQRSSCKQSFGQGSPKYEIINGQLELVGYCGYQAGTIANLILKVISHSQIINAINDFKRQNNALTDEDISLYFKIIEEMYKITNKSNGKFAVMFIKAPELDLINSNYTNQKIIDEIYTFSDIFVDVTLSDKLETLDEKYFFHKEDTHPTAIANYERAQLIGEIISRN